MPTVTLISGAREVVISRGIDYEAWGVLENTPEMRTTLAGTRIGFNPSAEIIEGELIIKLVSKDEADEVRGFLNDYLKFARSFDIHLDSGDIGAGDGEPLEGCYWIGDPTTAGYVTPRGRGAKWDIRIPYRCPLIGLKSIWNETPPATFTLDRVDYSAINMIADNDNVKTFTLTAYDTDDNDVTADVSWSSSDSNITSNGSGSFTCIGDTVGTASLSAVHDGVTETCTARGWATLPSDTVLKTLQGGSGDNSGTSWSTIAQFSTTEPIVEDLNCCSIALSATPAGGFVEGCLAIASGSYNIESIVPWNTGNNNADRRKLTTSSETTSRGLYQFGPSSTAYFDRVFTVANGTSTYYDSTVYPNTLRYSDSFVASDNISLYFGNITDKMRTVRWDDGLTKAEFDALGVNGVKFAYVPQIFRIRTGATNYTEIPNLGIRGSAWDLEADNVPAGWFAI